jgi:hypothetical protein
MSDLRRFADWGTGGSERSFPPGKFWLSKGTPVETGTDFLKRLTRSGFLAINVRGDRQARQPRGELVAATVPEPRHRGSARG